MTPPTTTTTTTQGSSDGSRSTGTHRDSASAPVPTVAPPSGGNPGGPAGVAPGPVPGAGTRGPTLPRAGTPRPAATPTTAQVPQARGTTAPAHVAADVATPLAPDTHSTSISLAGMRRFLIGIAPGALLLLGAIALLGSGSFLDALRNMRS